MGTSLVNAAVLASGGLTERSLWYPTILGVLVFIAAISLFCGTIYLLLATNLGARLGFLIAGAGLSGLMMLMASLWMTTSFPLTTLKGRIPQWVALESIDGGDTARSPYVPVQTIRTPGNEADIAEMTNVKASVDQALVNTSETGAISEEVGTTARFAVYESASDYIVKDVYETGGGTIFSQVDVSTSSDWPWLHVSLHEPLYAMADLCPVDSSKMIVPFGDPIPPPVCDKSKGIDSLVFVRDLGSMRMPPFVAFLASGTLFALFLLGLHWRERDLLEMAAVSQPEKQPELDAAEDKTLEPV